MKKWSGWRSEHADEKYDAIIIGSGMSGLTAGVLLARNGKKVLILEKHFKAGGWTHTFCRKKYEWDVGIHYIGEVHSKRSPVRKLFDIVSDNKLKWHKMDDNYDRIIFPDKEYNFIAPRERFIPDMAEYFPGTEDKLVEYLKMVDESVKSGQNYFGNKALPEWLSRLSYSFMTNKYFKYSNRTTEDVLMEIFNDKKMLGVLCGQWGDHGLPPAQSSFAMHAAVVRHYLNGGNYPIGTSRQIAETVSDNLEKMGGKLYVNAPVDKILINKGKTIGVRLEGGEEIYAPLVISSAGVVNTYGKFLRDSSNSKKYEKSLQTVSQTSSYACLYMGFKISPKELQEKNTNYWIYPSYNHDKNLENYLQDRNKEFPVVYLSFPSAKDPTYMKANPGYSTMEAITVLPFEDFEEWQDKPWKKRGKSYESQKEKISQRILDKVYKHVPAAKSTLDYYELSTPLSVKSLANYNKGELYGIDHTPGRFHQRWLRPRTDIKNLYLTGQDVLTVGVTSALFSGLITASSILKKNLMRELIKN